MLVVMILVEIVIIPMSGWQQLAKDVENGAELWKFADYCPVSSKP